MKTLFIFFLVLSISVLNAQNEVTWSGGTPGRETHWHEAKNWSNHRVPDAFSNVIIPDIESTTLSFPIIAEGVVEVNSLLLASNAELLIRDEAKMIVYGQVVGVDRIEYHLSGTIMIMDETKVRGDVLIAAKMSNSQ